VLYLFFDVEDIFCLFLLDIDLRLPPYAGLFVDEDEPNPPVKPKYPIATTTPKIGMINPESIYIIRIENILFIF
jgi:hypothetical protein